jgi:hypothetical protein
MKTEPYAAKNRLAKSGQSVCGAAGGPDGFASIFIRNGAYASPFSMTINPARRSIDAAAKQ